MKIVIEIELGNDAMQTGGDVSWVLGKVAGHIEEVSEGSGLVTPGLLGVVSDANGNSVGYWEVRD